VDGTTAILVEDITTPPRSLFVAHYVLTGPLSRTSATARSDFLLLTDINMRDK
jgi:hypothetical protein